VKYLDYKKSEIKLVDETPDFRCKSCAKEPETVQWIEKYVKDGDNFLDIGANIGAYSLIAASLGARVTAFEPAIPNFDLLFRNIVLNRFDGVIDPMPFMVSDGDGLKDFGYSEYSPGAALHNMNNDSLWHWVQAYKLDSIIFDQPDHVKIDVDGYEDKVLYGAINLLMERPAQTMQVEIPSTSDALIQWLYQFGYEVIKQTIRNDSKYRNVLFLYKGK